MNRSKREWFRARILEEEGMDNIKYSITEAMENLDNSTRAKEEFP